MPLTLAEAKSLSALGIVIPPDILAAKARLEECRERRGILAKEGGGMPPEWAFRAEFEAALERAEKAEGRRDPDAAATSLDEAASLLTRKVPPVEPPKAEAVPPPPPPPAPPPPPPAADPVAKPLKVKAATGNNVLFVQSRIAWQNACKLAGLELARMESSILTASGDSPNAKDIAGKVGKLHSALGGYDEQLQDKLDEAVSATTDKDRERLRGEARDLIARILAFAESDPLLKAIDQNPFGAFNVKNAVCTTLQTLAGKFG